MICIIKQEGLYQNKVTVSLASIHYIVKWPISPGYYSRPKRNRRQWFCKILGDGVGGGGVKKGKTNEATCKRKLQLPTCWELLRPFANS